MARVLCATRGGAASYCAQDAAIRRASERGEELLFLYVVDTSFLDKTAPAARPDIVETEMAMLGELLLGLARERAAGQGVRADVILRHGLLRDELTAVAREYEISAIILGRPAEGGLYSLEEIESTAAEIKARTGSEVLIF